MPSLYNLFDTSLGKRVVALLRVSVVPLGHNKLWYCIVVILSIRLFLREFPQHTFSDETKLCHKNIANSAAIGSLRLVESPLLIVSKCQYC